MNRVSRLRTAFMIVALLAAFAVGAGAQNDLRRSTVAITYPLDQTIEVAFHGTTRLPRLKGTAKVRRQGRRGTRVELNLDNLPRAYELGGVYTTYVLWAISPDGHVDNLGEIKRSGSGIIDSKIDVTTPLQTFATALSGRDGSVIWKEDEPALAANHAISLAPRSVLAASHGSGILLIGIDPSRIGLRAVAFPRGTLKPASR